MSNKMKKSDLEIFLKQYNLWYHGMTIKEMKECHQALENSLSESFSSGYSSINSSNNSAGHLSTSGGSSGDSLYSCDINYNNFTNFRLQTQPLNTTTTLLESSPPSSPETVKRFIVRADVHHPMDWSPPKSDKSSKNKKYS